MSSADSIINWVESLYSSIPCGTAAGLDTCIVKNSLPNLIGIGLTFTIELTFLAAIGGVILGTIIALLRLSGSPVLRAIATGYVNLVRSLPLLLVIFWFYFLVPFLRQLAVGSDRPLPLDPFNTALITFTMFEAAYFSEIMRAGIQSLARGQTSAAYALGLSYAQAMFYVVLPQAFRNMLPIILTQTIILFQDTSLVYVLSLNDFLSLAGKIAQRDGRLTELYLFCAIVYFLISFFASTAVRRLQARTAIIR